MTKNRQHIGAIGTDERIAVYFGLKIVIGKLRVASVNATLDGLLQSNDAVLHQRHAQARRHQPAR